MALCHILFMVKEMGNKSLQWKTFFLVIYKVHTISFQTFFVWTFKIVVDSRKFTMLLLYILWDDNFYDSRFKWTATAAFEIHPTKAWLSQLMNFINAIWHFRRTICNKILFETWKKCHRNIWNASDCFSTILHESSISFWVAQEIQGRQRVCEGWEVWEE